MQAFSPVLAPKKDEDNTLSPMLGGARTPKCDHCQLVQGCECIVTACECCKMPQLNPYLGLCLKCEMTHSCPKCSGMGCCKQCAPVSMRALMVSVPVPTSPEVCYECAHPHACYWCQRTYSTVAHANACCDD